MKLRPLSQQVIVITGASSGIGLATAERAAREGARVVLAARSVAVLQRIASAIKSSGGNATAAPVDVSNSGQLEQVARLAVETYGRIDTWINNAGVSIYGRLDEVSDEDSRRLFDVNFWGVVYGSLTALRHLRTNPHGGAIINVGSEVSEAVIPLQGMYSASKHAVKGFTDALRVEVEEVDKAPISITLVQPTAVDTPYPHHAKNYMNQEPKLPSPMIDPGDVSQAILGAATTPIRHVHVGMMSKINTAIARVAPALSDKLSALQHDRQQYDEPPRDPEGTLYKPSDSGQTHGEARLHQA